MGRGQFYASQFVLQLQVSKCGDCAADRCVLRGAMNFYVTNVKTYLAGVARTVL